MRGDSAREPWLSIPRTAAGARHASRGSVRGKWTLLLPPAACVAVGLILALAPALVFLGRTGSWGFLPNYDAQLYLQIAARAYFSAGQHAAVSARLAALYPRLLFTLPAVAARLAGWTAFAVNGIWRAWSGVALALGFYALFVLALRPRRAAAHWRAALLAAAVMAEPGPLWITWLLHGGWRPLLAGRLGIHPTLQPLWRIVDPAVSLPFLLAFLALWLAAAQRGARRPAWPWIAAAGGALGLLFYVYFYDWTAALVALALTAILARPQARNCAAIAAIGVAIGAAGAWHASSLHAHAAPGAMARLNVFVPVGRLALRAEHWGLVGILLVSALLFWIAHRRRPGGARTADAAPAPAPNTASPLVWPSVVGSLVAAAFLLSNSQFITGIEMQNNHWYRFLGHPLAVVLLLAAVEELVRRRMARAAWTAILIVIVIFGVYLRWRIGLRQTAAPPTASVAAFLAAAPPMAPGRTVAGSLEYADLAAVAYGARPLSGYSTLIDPGLDDRNWSARWALNAWLAGRPQRAGRRGIRRWLAQLFGPVRSGPAAADGPVMSAAQRARLGRLARHALRRIRHAPAAYLRRYHVRWLALAAGRNPPPVAGADWSIRGATGPWRVWRLRWRFVPAAAAPAVSPG